MEAKEQVLPPLVDGELVTVLNIDVREKATRPPSHYTEETLLGDMLAAAKYIESDPDLKRVLKQTSGLGTSATRAAIIETLKSHRYIETKGKYLIATNKGSSFITWIEAVMPELVDVALTARWEALLGVVAEKGGGAAFEKKVADEVTRLVSVFKAAPAMGYTPTSSSTEPSRMNDDSAPKRASKPTEKMMEFAQSIARKLGVELEPEVLADFDACRAFLDANKDAAMRPSEKQLKFANSIAASRNLTIPAEVLANGRELSRWIDENK